MLATFVDVVDYNKKRETQILLDVLQFSRSKYSKYLKTQTNTANSVFF